MFQCNVEEIESSSPLAEVKQLLEDAPNLQAALNNVGVWNPFRDPFQTEHILRGKSNEKRLDAIEQVCGAEGRQKFIDNANLVGRTNRWYRLYRAKLVEVMALQQLFRWYWDQRSVALLLSFLKPLVGREGINDHFTNNIFRMYQDEHSIFYGKGVGGEQQLNSLFQSRWGSAAMGGTEKLWESIVSRSTLLNCSTTATTHHQSGGSRCLTVEPSHEARLLFSLNASGEFYKNVMGESLHTSVHCFRPPGTVGYFPLILDELFLGRGQHELRLTSTTDIFEDDEIDQSVIDAKDMTNLQRLILEAIEREYPDAVQGAPEIQVFGLKESSFLTWLEDLYDPEVTKSLSEELLGCFGCAIHVSRLRDLYLRQKSKGL